MRTYFFVLFTIVFLTASCSRNVKDPCINKDPVSEIIIDSNKVVCFESTDSYDLNYKNKRKIVINGNTKERPFM